MARWAKRSTVLLMVLALASLGAAQAGSCSRPLRTSTGQWEPYAYYDARGRYTGIDADLLRAIAKEAGCQLVELDAMPAARNLSLFEKGGVDVMTGASRTAERQRLARFSVAYRSETVGMFALADKIGQYRHLASFADFTAGPLSLIAPRAGWYGAAFEAEAASLQRAGRLTRFGDFAQGVRMLAAGRASFMLGDAAAIEHAAARAGIRVQPLPFWVEDAPVYLMFSRATVSAADVARIDAAIARLQKRGVFAQIRRSYGGH